MRCIKTYIRATKQNARLSNLPLIFIDKENSEKLLKDSNPVLEVDI